MTSNHAPARYHLTLTSEGRTAMQGWWGSETVARQKFTEWVGGWKLPDTTVTLVDEETGETLTTWPDGE
ncbi:hypothetical protein [Streptomyces sp. enrichment culture]|uniref:hypothetical protein n=1 Tax=Streptomyces sp. enrichment culture TaxID=1795815 RepID=UPI003F550FAA